ncbi:MAG: TetR/AcrR family transcriptional regulator [Novosphingobium sp.]
MPEEIAVSSPRRQAILDAAAAVFAEKGFHGTGMRDIADRLGMKAGSLYFHLASKDAALEEVCAAGMHSAIRAAEQGFAAGPGLSERIRAMAEAQVELLAAHGDYISVFVHERRQLSEPAQQRLVEVSQKHRQMLDRIFDEARERGELAVGLSPRSARYAMVGVLRNLTQLYVEGPVRDFPEVARQIIDIFLDGAQAR